MRKASPRFGTFTRFWPANAPSPLLLSLVTMPVSFRWGMAVLGSREVESQTYDTLRTKNTCTTPSRLDEGRKRGDCG
jgi:hypothetical protein